ncbi:enoyl-CoA hydratase/isomerase family protein [Bailinhaonella thermotolerans]|uniref:Enoyl-CoA hydratase/isomerase family protein n=1 Tax=Bailinhaonella thermotolerans TaxID=1070861 RepID=A0A3A4APG5_9ACTN|nr:enoyl-CoA hydratase-related protein [Bailinhaonella thermotolerans]RJL30921.1 enoyl-CoA hydratase/isomerase family protein [Bailinhaonella thermotolerans]
MVGVHHGFELTRDDRIATLTLNRPEKRNAINAEMWRAIPGILAGLAADPGVRVLVLTGAGGTFCAGADISDLAGLAEDEDDTGVTVVAEEALAAFPKPTIAMIEGFCVGGGCQLAGACDLRFAAGTARFGIPPAKLGLVYPASTTRRLVGLVGPATAKRLLFSGDLIDAAHALRTGLIDELHPAETLAEAVYGFARTLASRSQLSIAAAKELINLIAADEPVGEPFRAWQKRARHAEDLHEGVAAFLERRPPNFTWTPGR